MILQTMYCSENCLNSDCEHKGECMKLSHPRNLKPFKIDEFLNRDPEHEMVCHFSIIFRLIARIGLDNIKKTPSKHFSLAT
jgi:hypothetical protein